MKAFVNFCFVVSTFAFHSLSGSSQMRFLDQTHSNLVCQAWNKSHLPRRLGSKGSGWIDCCGANGQQVVVVARGDCKDMPKIRFSLDRDAAGQAICNRADVFKEGDTYIWKLEPKTSYWIDFADSFGLLDLPFILDVFEGDHVAATSNRAGFETFFAITAKVGLENNVDFACAGANMKEIKSELDDLDKEDMTENAASEG